MKDPATGRRVSRPNQPEDWITADVPELRIVEQGLWDRAKARQGQVSTGPQAPSEDAPRGFWTTRRPRHLLSGLVMCGVCGVGMIQVGKSYVGCAAYRNKGTCNHSKLVRRERLEEAVLDGLKSRMMSPELVETFCDEYVREVNRIRAEGRQAAGDLRRERAQAETSIRNIVEAVKAGLFSPAMKAELAELEARREEIDRRLAADAAEPEAPALHPKLAEVYANKVAQLAEALRASDSRAEAMDLIRGLIERIVIRPGEDGVPKAVLAELLRFAATDTTTPAGGSGGRSGTLVAGAGFEPATFRL